MKMKNITKTLLILGVLLSSCNGDFSEPDYYAMQQWEKEVAEAYFGNKISFAQLSSKANSQISLYNEDDAFEGYVISSDLGGNVYKKVYIQALDKSGTVAVLLEKKGLSGDYPVGTKILLKLKGTTIWYNSRYSLVEIGYGQGQTAAGNIKMMNMPASVYSQALQPEGEIAPLSEIASTYQDIKSMNKQQNLNKLVELKNVHFRANDVGQPFHNPANQYNTTYTLEDGKGGTLTFITSSFATYGKDLVPSGNLTITGILTRYNSTYQLSINNITDIKK